MHMSSPRAQARETSLPVNQSPQKTPDKKNHRHIYSVANFSSFATTQLIQTNSPSRP